MRQYASINICRARKIGMKNYYFFSKYYDTLSISMRSNYRLLVYDLGELIFRFFFLHQQAQNFPNIFLVFLSSKTEGIRVIGFEEM